MNKKEKKKLLRRKVGLCFIKSFTFLSGVAPLSINLLLGKILGSLAYLVLSRHRKIALNSLAIAFPNYSLSQREKIAKQFFVFIAEGGFELIYYLNNIKELHGTVKIKGKENLDQALAKGKGAILVTAHYGNFPLMSLRLAAEGYPVNLVARPMRDKYAEAHFHKLRTDAGVKSISVYPRRACVAGIINALANNEIVIILMDQNFGTGGVWVKFFNKLAATPTGPIILSLRTKAALIPSYIYRLKEKEHCLKVCPEKELTLGKDKNETILINAAEFTKIIEGWIRQRPEHWSWVHRRWKSRPSENTNKDKIFNK
ncbi:MAG: lysophospholipid acyltransferase family protein [Candidatus Omnitrophica bacterium]|nr:lysophospholipid acyltransferase family protein [Candidatus Omnitrophota bacterium]MCF7893938.1 lysophospholipid acyltransferase family protein [Candidatus Omnitrophota bacterium]